MDLSNLPRSTPLLSGLIARVAIQCPCPDTGEVGCFLFSGDSVKVRGSRVSQVYACIAELLWDANQPGSQWHQVTPGNCANGFVYTPSR